MAPSLSLTAYLAFARRESSHWQQPDRLRPDGTLIWVHCAVPSDAIAMVQLGRKLATQRDDGHVILTVSAVKERPLGVPDCVQFVELPSENPADVSRFFHHWEPDVLLWKGPAVRPALISGAHERGIPSFLIDADELDLEHRNWRWLPDSLKPTLQLFTKIYAHDSASGFRLRRMLGMEAQVEDSGPLLEDSPALNCSESDLDDLSDSLTARPVWLAARIQPEELNIVLTAQRATMRLSPRLLLMIVPDRPEQAAAIRTECEAQKWRVSHWDDAEMPEERTQILLAENAEELGLFYRVAPITLLGSSLVSGHGGRNPFEPAALGSAVLYGPGVRQHLQAYSRLARAGAARIVKDVESLSAALASLMAPDKVAKLVHAGWETVSEGAMVTDHILEQINETLDQKDAK